MAISDEELQAVMRAVKAAYDALGDECEVIILIKATDIKAISEGSR